MNCLISFGFLFRFLHRMLQQFFTFVCIEPIEIRVVIKMKWTEYHERNECDKRNDHNIFHAIPVEKNGKICTKQKWTISISLTRTVYRILCTNSYHLSAPCRWANSENRSIFHRNSLSINIFVVEVSEMNQSQLYVHRHNLLPITSQFRQIHLEHRVHWNGFIAISNFLMQTNRNHFLRINEYDGAEKH